MFKPHNSIATITVTENYATSAAAFPRAGVRSDVEPTVVGVFFVFAVCLAALNIFTLWQHRLSRAQVKANRLFQILEQGNKQIAGIVFGFKLRLIKEFTWKVLFPTLTLVLISLENIWAIGTGIVLTLALVFWITYGIARELLHPRSTFNRSYLMFDKNPRFVRMRSIFEVIRKTFYFVVGFAFLSYACHRLDPNAFEGYDGKRPLFLTHVESSLSLLTPTSDPLSAGNSVGSFFRIMRALIMLAFVFTFIGMLTARFSPFDFKRKDKRRRDGVVKIHITEISCRKDVARLVLELAGASFEHPRFIALKSSFKHGLRATDMEMAEFQQAIEQVFEWQPLDREVICSRHTLEDVVDYLWDRLNRERHGDTFPKLFENAAPGLSTVKSQTP